MSFLQGLFGPPNVEKLKAKGNIKGLIRALCYKKDKDVRRAAAYALGELKAVKSVESLIAAIEDKDVRKAAAQALGQIGDARAVEPLIAALKDSDWGVRWRAAAALGQIGDARAVEPLIAALKDSSAGVRQDAAQALDQLHWQPGQDANGAAYWIAKRQWDKCVAIGTPAVEPLIAALKDGDGYVRAAAAQALGQIGDARAVEPLIAAFEDSSSSWDARRAAAAALGQLGDARAVEPLSAALKDSIGDVRQAAAQALGQIGDARAVEPLIAALKYDIPEAVEALAKIGDIRAANALISEKRWGQCVELGALAIEPLIACLTASKKDVRVGAATALVQLYQSGELDGQSRQRILSQRSAITIRGNHTDRASEHLDHPAIPGEHVDRDGSNTGCGHTDSGHEDSPSRHIDFEYGGVDFPL